MAQVEEIDAEMPKVSFQPFRNRLRLLLPRFLIYPSPSRLQCNAVLFFFLLLFLFCQRCGMTPHWMITSGVHSTWRQTSANPASK